MGCGVTKPVIPLQGNHEDPLSNLDTEKQISNSEHLKYKTEIQVSISNKPAKKTNGSTTFQVSSHKGASAMTHDNQDSYRIEEKLSDDVFFACVLDGHGPHGALISKIATEFFVDQSKKKLEGTTFEDAEFGWDHFIESLFSECDAHISQHEDIGFRSRLSGTTATIVFIEGMVVHTGHVGDSRTILHSERNGLEIITKDHRLDDDEERLIIETKGGIVRGNGGSLRVYLSDAQKEELCLPIADQLPGLMLSRTLGDELAKKAGCVAKPTVAHTNLSVKGDCFLICASDGVWDMLLNEVVVKLAQSGGIESVVQEALKSWEAVNQADNITAIMISLKDAS